MEKDVQSVEFRVVVCEDALRREIARIFVRALGGEPIDACWFAGRACISVDQAEKILHHKTGGPYHLSALARACDAFGVDLDVSAKAVCQDSVFGECGGSVCGVCGFCQRHAYDSNREGDGRCNYCDEIEPSGA